MNAVLKNFQDKSDAKFTSIENKLKGFFEFIVLEKESLSSIHFRLWKDNISNHTSISNSVIRLNNLSIGENCWVMSKP